MILLGLLEFVVILLLLLFLITQIIIPLCRGTSWYPIFRREAKLQKDISQVKQAIVERQMEEDLEKFKNILKPDQEKEGQK